MATRQGKYDVGKMRRVLAYNIKRYREDRDLSQAYFGKLVGWTQQQVSDVEKAIVYVEDFCQMMAVSLALNVPVNRLFVPPYCMELLPEPPPPRKRKRNSKPPTKAIAIMPHAPAARKRKVRVVDTNVEQLDLWGDRTNND